MKTIAAAALATAVLATNKPTVKKSFASGTSDFGVAALSWDANADTGYFYETPFFYDQDFSELVWRPRFGLYASADPWVSIGRAGHFSWTLYANIIVGKFIVDPYLGINIEDPGLCWSMDWFIKMFKFNLYYDVEYNICKYGLLYQLLDNYSTDASTNCYAEEHYTSKVLQSYTFADDDRDGEKGTFVDNTCSHDIPKYEETNI